jgi:hypothetical protein
VRYDTRFLGRTCSSIDKSRSVPRPRPAAVIARSYGGVWGDYNRSTAAGMEEKIHEAPVLGY